MIDYQQIIDQYPWIVERNQKCILSPDADGLLCGLLMSHYLGWNIVGFYDGKVLLLQNGISVRDCIFLDMEILRNDIRSIGHHMNIHNLNDIPDNYCQMMSGCINPNYIRGFDRCHNFNRKYPLGTIHLLLYILEKKYPNTIKINEDGMGVLFFADGVWKVLFKYTDNVLDWFEYLHSDISSIWWKSLQELPVIELIQEINKLLHDMQSLHPDNKQLFGHINISDFENQKDNLISIVRLFANLLNWEFVSDKWKIFNLNRYQFTKKIFEESKSNQTFFNILEQKPLSLAMTEGSIIQYTLETPDLLP